MTSHPAVRAQPKFSRQPHVLIIPSEEFVPRGNHLSGIFQLHQAQALMASGFRVGGISISLAFSIPMILKAIMNRAMRHRSSNRLGDYSVRSMLNLLRLKITAPEMFVESDKVENVPIVRIEGFYYFSPSIYTNHIAWIQAGWIAFQEYCRLHGRPDFIHAHNLESAGMLAHVISKRTGIRFVVTEHSTFFERKLIPSFLYPRLRRAARSAAGLAAVSPQLARTLCRELGSLEIHYIPNVLDPIVVNSRYTADQSPDNRFTFLALGNLIPIKDHASLLYAFRMAFADDSAVALRIGGDGPLVDELHLLARSLDIESSVEFLGRLTREDVVRELDDCDAFVLPSKYETFGVVVIEALARGKPVVSTICGGPETFVTLKDGLLVPVSDTPALSLAMNRLRVERSKYDDAQIRERALARFGPEAFINTVTQFYHSAGCLNV